MSGFVIVGVVGLLVLGLSLLLGDLFGGPLDGLLEGPLGSVFDWLGGGVFSTAVIGGFLSALGFGEVLAAGLGLPVPFAVLTGVGAGFVAAVFAVWLTGLVRDSSSDATLTTDDTLGREGRVISAVPADGLGTVRILVGGHAVQLNARAEQPMAAGTAVYVTAVLSPTAVAVAPVHDVLLPPDPTP